MGSGTLLLLLVGLVLAGSGCSSQESDMNVKAQTQAGEAQTGMGDAAASAPTEANANYTYAVRDDQFVGTGDMARSLQVNYCLVPVTEGDVIEIEANADAPARFLVGSMGLANHYLGGYVAGVRGMEDNYMDYVATDVSSMTGETVYDQTIRIADPDSFIIVFAVQDMQGGSDVRGHMKISVSSAYPADWHKQRYDSIMQGEIDRMRAKNEAMQREIDRMDREQPMRDAQAEDWATY